MYFYGRIIFQAVSATIISSIITGCSQDTMIRINSISSIKLIANQEIRYKACGENSDGCQEIFQNINNKKAKLIETAQMNREIYMSNKNRIIHDGLYKELEKCNTVIQRFPADVSVSAPMFDQQNLANQRRMCQEGVTMSQSHTPVVDADENNFKPTGEDIKKVTKEVITTSLNEYTFSKSDGSIVIICPTRYCAIANADGTWIGIGEQKKPNELVSLISN
jgi:hypothetical protein